MKLVVFGLSVSSSWGNGHATVWRGLIGALARMGHTLDFFERSTPYYAAHRDYFELPAGKLYLYEGWEEVLPAAARALSEADVAMITSYCPDALPATELALASRADLKVFYDLDTPMTLDREERGEGVPYLGALGLRPFDLVLSFGGGPALDLLASRFGARRVAPLYGGVDSSLHSPAKPEARYRADLSYLGTYAAERQLALEHFFIRPSILRPALTFAIGGSQYPQDFPWRANIRYLSHVPPAKHAAFYGSARLNLSITRGPMARMGFCPSGRLFEAAACGGALISDAFPGLDAFYEPGREILVARDTDDVLEALSLSPEALRTMAHRARERTLAEHTVEHRARELIAHLERASAPELHSMLEEGA